MDEGRRDYLRRVALATVTDHVTVEVVAALRAASIRTILLKGPATAAWLYDDPLDRLHGDADLLVDPERIADARQTLQCLGFRNLAIDVSRYEPDPYDEPWIRRETVVELHHTLSGARGSPQSHWAALTADTEWIPLSGTDIEVLAPAGRALVIVLHAAHHGKVHERPLTDVARALERAPLEVWQQARALAEQVDATAAFAAGLRLLPRGGELAGQLDLPATRAVDAELRAASAPHLALVLDWLARGSATRRQKLIVIGRRLFPPAEFIRASSRLATRGRLGFAAARVARPFALLARVPAAAAAYRRARRAVTRG